jgi:hypothetical protein
MEKKLDEDEDELEYEYDGGLMARKEKRANEIHLLVLLAGFGRIHSMASDPNDRSRVVAARIAFWFVVEAKRLAKAGSTAQEIIEHLNDCRHVLKDWRDDSPDHPLNLPSNDMPEFWPSGSLEKFIAIRKPAWLKDPDQGDNPPDL